ncbi:coiled-coil domain-containing protein [Vibrio mimicus]|uniref:Chromosome segregation ATPase n=1 Tax=Vibrio mimicus VM603 TaxID=671074 RepID=D2YHT2_VIBMI|nr:hypothetical protein [Vibrio mimicus]EEW05690.1 hypothetical protein VMB_30790 [Vibrio mimicus VM603]
MSIDLAKKFEVAGIIVGLVGSGALGSWAIYQDTLKQYETQISNYEKAKDFPNLLENISSVSRVLNERLSLLNDYDTLQSEVTTLKESNLKLSEEIEVSSATYEHKIQSLRSELANQKKLLESKVASLQKEVSEFKSEVTAFELNEGAGTSLKGGLVQVGFTSGNMYNVCKVTVNNKKYELEAGSSVTVDLNGRSCKVVLNKCSDSVLYPSRFELLCSS